MATDREPRPGEDRPSPFALWRFSTLLMLGLTACFALQYVVVIRMAKPYDAYLALSGYGMKSWHLWELLTYQLVHRGPWHWLLNLIGLWFLARPIETILGRKRFLVLYLGAVLTGAVLQGVVALTGFLLPESQEPIALMLRDRFGGPVAGASVGLCGLLAVWCLRERGTKLLLFSFLPLKPLLLFWIALGLAVLFIFLQTDPGLAHLAHLGGLLAGAAFFKLGKVRPSGRQVVSGAGP